MQKHARYRFGLLLAAQCAAFFLHHPALAGDWSGDVGLELRAFTTRSSTPAIPNSNLSLYLHPEYYHDWDNDRIVIAPFVRLDENDPERSHADLREAYWRHSFETAELTLGLRRVFWGVTESAHLVDIINQTDLVENLDTEDKLGQPMISLSLIRDWGTVDLFVMPYFRERTFSSQNARLNGPLYIDESAARFES
ncbi:MAG: hypothetical protein KJO55_08080, partial [Gammaproteobacteria bacterium]|nr:hypothetical protein [Gammaproteobacteria bacterium]